MYGNDFYKKMIVFCVTVLFFQLIYTVNYGFCLGWQDTLEGTFDIVETFDQLQDWGGESGYISDLSKMPKKTDGSASIWTFYSSDKVAQDNWIKNHGTGLVWNGTKSLCINYKNLGQGTEGVYGYGASRMSTFCGDGSSGKSGYSKMYLFYMIKFHSGFFARNASNDGYAYIGVIKFTEFCTGFTGVRYWGNTSEHTNSACQCSQVLDEYGVNDTVMNIGGGGDSWKTTLLFKENTFAADYKTSEWIGDQDCWGYSSLRTSVHYGDTDFSSIYENDEWMGVEYAFDVGTPGNADGSVEVWIYNESGTLIGHHTTGNQAMIREFDHYYNKVTIGGNMIQEHADAATPENRFYVDDFIINDSRIGPKYFALLSGAQPPTPVPDVQPKNVNVNVY